MGGLEGAEDGGGVGGAGGLVVGDGGAQVVGAWLGGQDGPGVRRQPRHATFTRRLPMLSPPSMPMKAAGAFSRPSTTSSR